MIAESGLLDVGKFWNRMFVMTGNPQHPNRGVLADLRSGLGKTAGCPTTRMLIQIAWAYKKAIPGSWDVPVLHMVSSLYGLHHGHTNEGHFGASCRQVIDRHKSASKTHGSIFENHLIKLIDASPTQLFGYLTNVVRMHKTKNVPINWRQLHEDLLRWQSPYRSVQIKWGTAIFG